MKAFISSPSYKNAPWTLHEGSRVTPLTPIQAEVLKLAGFPLLGSDGLVQETKTAWQALWKMASMIDVGFKPYLLETLGRIEKGET
jgi:hypothetical protein